MKTFTVITTLRSVTDDEYVEHIIDVIEVDNSEEATKKAEMMHYQNYDPLYIDEIDVEELTEEIIKAEIEEMKAEERD